MTNLSKYRKFSTLAVMIMMLAWLSALASLWNSLLTSEVKNEGWVVIFMLLVMISGVLLFYLAYVSADASALEKARKEAFEAGKSESLQEAEKKIKDTTDEIQEAEDSRKTVEAILAGIHGVRSENGLCNKLLIHLAREMGFVQGIMYVKNKKDSIFNPSGEYALTERKPQPFKNGDTLPGQAALNKSRTVLYDIPENYFVVSSGLGNSQPRYLMLVPVVYNGESIAVLELAAFKKPDEITGKIIDQVLSEVGSKLNKLITA